MGRAYSLSPIGPRRGRISPRSCHSPLDGNDHVGVRAPATPRPGSMTPTYQFRAVPVCIVCDRFENSNQRPPVSWSTANSPWTCPGRKGGGVCSALRGRSPTALEGKRRRNAHPPPSTHGGDGGSIRRGSSSVRRRRRGGSPRSTRNGAIHRRLNSLVAYGSVVLYTQ